MRVHKVWTLYRISVMTRVACIRRQRSLWRKACLGKCDDSDTAAPSWSEWPWLLVDKVSSELKAKGEYKDEGLGSVQSLCHCFISIVFWFHGYCMLCLRLRAALLYVGFHYLSLHASAYVAIFKCVGVFIYLFSSYRIRANLLYL
jgi:hypothetical protein